MGIPRLREVLGAPVGELTESHISGLVDQRVEESFDLDFKETVYGSSDGDKQSLAVDVAALANSGGGLLLLGLRDEDSVAIAVTPVTFSETEELKMRQVVADRVFPKPAWAIHRVPTSKAPSTGFYACVVHQSPIAPHAVFHSGNLKYPVRDQKRNRPLGEHEVAERYRHRFEHARSVENRVAAVMADGRSGWYPPEFILQCALAPIQPGSLRLSERLIQGIQDELWGAVEQRTNHRTPPRHTTLFKPGIVVPSTGYRRVCLRDGQHDPGEGTYDPYYAELHTDGAGYLGVHMSPFEHRLIPKPTVILPRQALLLRLGSALMLLARHAVDRTGTSGDALVATTFSHSRDDNSIRNVVLDPGGEHPTQRDVRQGRGVYASNHTLNLDAFISDPTERLLLIRAVATDFFQAFGYPEVDLIDDKGRLVNSAWKGAAHSGPAMEAFQVGKENFTQSPH